MRKKFGFMVLAAVALFAGLGQTASATGGGTYPPSPDPTTVWVDKPTINVGDSLTISAKGLCTTSPVTFVFAQESSSAGEVQSAPITVGTDGKASFTFRVPGPAGPYLAWAKQPSCNVKVSAAVTVKDAVTTPTPLAAPKVVAPKAVASAPISVSASNLCPAESATFTLSKGSTPLATLSQVALADGSASVTFPAQPAGEYTVTVTQACGTNSSMALLVESLSPTPAPAAPAAPAATPTATPTQVTPAARPVQLPTTGSDPMQFVQLGLIALLTGVSLSAITLHRRHRGATAG